MALNVTLANLVSDFRSETGRALAPALSVGDALHDKYLLRRTQDMLANEDEWPHLLVYRDIAFGSGQRYAAYPADLPFEAIRSVHVRQSTAWQRVTDGIGPIEYTTTDSESGATGFPIIRWEHTPDTNSIEVWPVPNQAATLRLRGRRTLRPLVNDSDPCDLDSTLIVLYAAAEYLARQKSEDAQLKLRYAQQFKAKLLARQSKTEPFVMGGGAYADQPRLRRGIDYI